MFYFHTANPLDIELKMKIDSRTLKLHLASIRVRKISSKIVLVTQDTIQYYKMWSQSKFNNNNNKKRCLSSFFFIVNCEWILTLCSILAIVNFELHLFTGPKTMSDVLIKVKKRWAGPSGVVFLKKHRLNHFRKP